MSQQGKRRTGRAANPGREPLKRWRDIGGVLLIASGVVLAGLVLVFVVGRSGGSGGNGDGQFPAYAYNSAMTLSGYTTAVRVPGALSVVPCYCGCGPSQGHLSLKECFFSPDGSFTDHASNCHLCVEEAVDVGEWYDDGLALKDIRFQIEQKYSGHGPPTNTPPVS